MASQKVIQFSQKITFVVDDSHSLKSRRAALMGGSHVNRAGLPVRQSGSVQFSVSGHIQTGDCPSICQ